jgi:iron complex outermembrane receptor protein
MVTLARRTALLVLACATQFLGASDNGPGRKVSDELVLFGDLPTVEAAALHAQTLAEAPANVSVITAADIRRYGYRTLAEALSAVRGSYATYDHIYHYVGVRGISLPGDYNTRFLVMLNGHPLTENIYNSNGFFGQDFGLDMDLVERIEIIRGPTSALYGSNGMLANINVVTRSPVDGERLRVSTENGTGGERKAFVSSSVYLGSGANLLVSGSAFNNTGSRVPGAGLGLAEGSVSTTGGERGYHSFANLIWHNWSITGLFNSRLKVPLAGWGTSLTGDPSQYVVDGRSLIAATWKGHAGPGKLQWRASYDRYRYRDRFHYPPEEGITTGLAYSRGDWLDSEFIYEAPVRGLGLLTMGVSTFADLRCRQYNVLDHATDEIIDRPDLGFALFAQQEWSLTRRWKIHAGVRLDDTRNFRRFLSPRVAAVYQPSARIVYKFVYGRPFRNPSAAEQFYHDGGLSVAPAARLAPEAAHTFEASLERQVGQGLAFTVNGFHYGINRVIAGVALPNDVYQYRNVGELRSGGVEFELSGKWRERIEAHVSTALQNARGEPGAGRLTNSPRQVSTLRLGAPFLRERFFLSGAWNYCSSRTVAGGERLAGPMLAHLTASVRLNRRFELAAGVRNVFDRRYEDPVYLSVDRLPGNGRSAFVKLVWRVWE